MAPLDLPFPQQMISGVTPNVWAANYGSGTGETRDDLVEDQDDVIPIADLPNNSKIFLGRGDDTARMTDRFEDYPRNGFRVLVKDYVLESLSGEPVAFIPRQKPIPVIGWLKDLEKTAHLRLERRLPIPRSTGRHGPGGGPVVT